MTVLRRDAGHISNYFNDLLKGIGHRGSSFMDLDAVIHDEKTDRFLFMEFKREGEPSGAGQRRVLEGLARRIGMTSWYVYVQRDGSIVVMDLGVFDRKHITSDQFRDLVDAWWDHEVSLDECIAIDEDKRGRS